MELGADLGLSYSSGCSLLTDMPLLLTGLWCIAFGELIRVFVDMFHNTAVIAEIARRTNSGPGVRSPSPSNPKARLRNTGAPLASCPSPDAQR